MWAMSVKWLVLTIAKANIAFCPVLPNKGTDQLTIS